MDESEFPFPQFPALTDKVRFKARTDQSYAAIAFEYLKSSSIAAFTFACIETQSPIWRDIQKLEAHVIRGLLARIGRLSKTVLQLSHDGDSREVVFIITRTITESAVNLLWCLRKDPERRFKRFVEAGVQADLELRNVILANAKARESELLIEKRMLKSLDRLATNSGFEWHEIPNKIALPNFRDRLKDIGLEELYHPMQRMPSQSVHGMWSDLLHHYLSDANGELMPRHEALSTPDVLFLFPALFILEALTACSKFCFNDAAATEAFCVYFSEARNNVLSMIQDSASDGFIGACREE